MEKISNDKSMANMMNMLFSIYKIKLFQTKTVRELMNGYEDSLLNIAKKMDSSVTDSKFSLINGVSIL